MLTDRGWPDVGGRLRWRPPRLLRFLLLRVTRPVFYGVLVAALAIAALTLLYLDNPTFGTHGTDWLPLVGWGFATDPISTALSNLRGSSTA
jgi:hypothetical protein